MKECAKRLKLSVMRVRQLLHQGRIVGAHKFGRDWAIPDPPVIDPPLQLERMTAKRRKAAAKVR